MHKYPFEEQLAIYMQNPNAKATATFNTWNKVGKYVRKGSKGIAVRDHTTNKWKYVFDISDTGQASKKEQFRVWNMHDEQTDAVLSSLENSLGLEAETADISVRLYEIVYRYIEEHFEDDAYLFQELNLNDSYLEGMDSDYKENILKETLIDSCMYAVAHRLGLQDKVDISEGHFSEIWNFSGKDSIMFLCESIQKHSCSILKQAEKEVHRLNAEKRIAKSGEIQYTKNNINDLKRKSKNKQEDLDYGAERFELQTGGRLPDSRSGLGAGQQRYREIRGASETVSVKNQEHPNKANGDVRRTDSGSGGHQPAGTGNGGQVDGREAETRPSPKQGDRPTGLGSSLQHASDGSGRSDSERFDLQLTLFDGEHQQIKTILEAEDLKSSAFFDYDISSTHSGENRKPETAVVDINSYQNNAHDENDSEKNTATETNTNKYELQFDYAPHMNGMSVTNLLDKNDDNSNFKTVAYIKSDRTVMFFDDELPESLIQQIYHYADNTEHDTFRIPPQTDEVKLQAVMEYTEPYVVIDWSESNHFTEGEKLTFTEADQKFRAVERLERPEHDKKGGYNKTKGKVYYLSSPHDKELSTYPFRYDIGDYREEPSGLFNHIKNASSKTP